MSSNAQKDRFLQFLLDGKLNDRSELIAHLILVGGLKPKEIVDLRKKHFSNQELRYRQPTTLTKQVWNYIEQLLASKNEDDFVFSNANNNQLSIRRVEQLVKELATTYGSEINTPMKLRKACLQTASDVKLVSGLGSVQQREFLDEHQVKLLHKQLGTESLRDRLLLQTLLESGIRINELIQLEQKHLVNGKLVIASDISYNNQERKVQVSSKLFLQLKGLGTILFASNRGSALTKRRFEQICISIGEKIGTALTPSLLRATAVAHLSQSQTLEEVQAQCGLSSDTFYTHGVIAQLTTTQPHATQPTVQSDEVIGRKDNEDENSVSNMYWRTRTRRGGGEDNE